jgi:hypothetical protein
VVENSTDLSSLAHDVIIYERYWIEPSTDKIVRRSSSMEADPVRHAKSWCHDQAEISLHRTA